MTDDPMMIDHRTVDWLGGLYGIADVRSTASDAVPLARAGAKRLKREISLSLSLSDQNNQEGITGSRSQEHGASRFPSFLVPSGFRPITLHQLEY